MNDYHTLLGVATGADPAEIEAAYERKKREYALPESAPADLRELAAGRLAALEAARRSAAAPAPAARAPLLTRREWLWTAMGVALALVILGAIAALTSDIAPAAGLTAVNRPAPDLTFQTLDGKTLRLADLRGKVVLVNFWATWCEPCKVETPDLVAAAQEFEDRGLAIIGINLTDQDNLEEVRRFVQRYNINYPIALDSASEAQRAFNIYPIPSSYFIDSMGQIRYTRINIVTRDDILQVLRELNP